FRGGPPTWNEDIQLELNRHGFVEETHFTIAYSAVRDDTADGGIGGVLATVHEISAKVVAERRVTALRDLGARVGQSTSVDEACTLAAQAFAAHEKEIPFALLYLIDIDRQGLRLASATGVETETDISPLTIDLRETATDGWPVAEAIRSGTTQIVT